MLVEALRVLLEAVKVLVGAKVVICQRPRTLYTET
jgi:hypothetical protein